MASLRPGTRKDGSTYVQVLYRLDGKQSSTSFEDVASAQKFQKMVDQFGPAKALEAHGLRSGVLGHHRNESGAKSAAGKPWEFSPCTKIRSFVRTRGGVTVCGLVAQ